MVQNFMINDLRLVLTYAFLFFKYIFSVRNVNSLTLHSLAFWFYQYFAYHYIGRYNLFNKQKQFNPIINISGVTLDYCDMVLNFIFLWDMNNKIQVFYSFK